MGKDNIKVITKNRKAQHDYHLETTYQAGIVLMGSEIKSIRSNNVNLRDSYVEVRDGELWLVGAHIALYQNASIFGHTDPVRPRKLLLHRREISQIIDKSAERGYTVIPTMIYLERGRAKVEIALARGKKQYDKREAIAKRDADREIRRALKEQYE
ncbi:MAG: SsrA-binding protein SmpB [Anaerolineae bacterium]|nr:SsrA-binding protein SmpB [Anaerolineae bacterium]